MHLPVKICCILSTDEIDMAIDAGAHAVGLVGSMPNGPGILDDITIARLARYTHEKYEDHIWSVLLTKETDASNILDHAANTHVNSVQIVDHDGIATHKTIREKAPNLRIIQVVHVENETAIETAKKASQTADVILLDSGKPSAHKAGHDKTFGGTFGGTGETHDWSISKRIVEVIDKPVFLAGGLNPDNVTTAIKAVKPAGLDICSGLRNKANQYELELEKLHRFRDVLRSDLKT